MVNSNAVQIDWGTANGTTIFAGTQYVWGTATDTTLSYGTQYVAAGGTADSTTIGTSGIDYVFAGGALNDVTFSGTFAALFLENASSFTGTVSGWQAQDQIDLEDVNFSSASLGFTENASNTGGMLTVADGTHVANLALLGQYSAADFEISSDGYSGTVVTNPGNPYAPAQNALAPVHGT